MAAGIEARPGLLGDLDASSSDRRMFTQHSMADRKTELFDLARPVFAGRPMHQILQRLAGRQPVSLALAKRRGKLPFEAERDGELLRIVRDRRGA